MKLDEITIPEPQELIALPPAKRAAVALKSEAAEAYLRELVAKTAEITNVVDKNGREEAHRAGMSLKNARVAIKNIGEEAREDAVAFQRAVVAEVARLAAITTEEETRLFALRDAYDAKVAAEKAERERIEAERVAAIRAKIAEIDGLPVKYAAAGSAALHGALVVLAQRSITEEEFAGFTAEARQAVDTAAASLLTLRNAARQREAEEAERQRKAEADRIELERLRAEQEAREKAEREAAAERERQARIERDKAEAERRAAADREAELQRQLAEMKAVMEALQRPAAPPPASPTPHGLNPGEIVGIPLVAAGQPVHMGVDLAAPDGDMTAEWIADVPAVNEIKLEPANSGGVNYGPVVVADLVSVTAEPTRPTDNEIITVLVEHYDARRSTVIEWLKGMDL